jgi:uncharacterized protein YyaL (SSP411 family)
LRDDKIITAWNGLMISAFAKAHQVLGDPSPTGASSYLHAATRAAAFIERELYDAERGVLFRSWRGGRSTVEGFAEDYALMIQALLDLYEASFEIRWLRWAERLQTAMDKRFWDAERGGYFNSQAGDPHIVLRLKEDYDGAEPAASSVAAMNLLRLDIVLGGDRQTDGAGETDEGYRTRGLRCLAAFQQQWMKTPQALPQMLCALELALDAPRHVVIAGDPATTEFHALAAVVYEQPGPRRALLSADAGEGQRWLATRAPWMAEMKPIDGRPAAYVCEEYACQAPVTTPDGLRKMLFGAAT